MRKGFPSWLEIAIFAYCLIQARDLPTSWLTAPAVRYGWVAFLIWFLPVLLYVGLTALRSGDKRSTPLFLVGAILLSLIGVMGSLNILKHSGLALACAGLLPFSWPVLVWLPASIAWMPGFGWLMKAMPFQLIVVMQLAITTLASWVLIQCNRRRWLHYE